MFRELLGLLGRIGTLGALGADWHSWSLGLKNVAASDELLAFLAGPKLKKSLLPTFSTFDLPGRPMLNETSQTFSETADMFTSSTYLALRYV